MRRILVILVAAACAATLVPATGASAAEPALAAVAVTGEPGEKPTVTFDAPFSVKSSVFDVRADGAGTEAAKGSKVLIDYVILNGRTGDEIETSFGVGPSTILLTKGFTAAIVDGLVGTAPGSRVVVAVAPKDGLTQGAASAGLKKNDTLLFVLDVRAVKPGRATGTPVILPDGPPLPAVSLATSGRPTITIPKGAAPEALVAQPLIRGDGPEVQAGQMLEVHYTGALWRNGKVFDSSWKRGQPAEFPIGNGSVIAGWDEGLVGQTVGSQVLLVIPPDRGYGPDGQPQAGIRGTDTLVFVVDILGAT